MSNTKKKDSLYAKRPFQQSLRNVRNISRENVSQISCISNLVSLSINLTICLTSKFRSHRPSVPVPLNRFYFLTSGLPVLSLTHKSTALPCCQVFMTSPLYRPYVSKSEGRFIILSIYGLKRCHYITKII